MFFRISGLSLLVSSQAHSICISRKLTHHREPLKLTFFTCLQGNGKSSLFSTPRMGQHLPRDTQKGLSKCLLNDLTDLLPRLFLLIAGLFSVATEEKGKFLLKKLHLGAQLCPSCPPPQGR